MPNVMVALPNIGGALCSTPQSLADAKAVTRGVFWVFEHPEISGKNLTHKNVGLSLL